MHPTLATATTVGEPTLGTAMDAQEWDGATALTHTGNSIPRKDTGTTPDRGFFVPSNDNMAWRHETYE